MLALIRASPPIFRVFHWHRPNSINPLIRRLFVVPRPSLILAVARLRLLGSRCKSTVDYELRVRSDFDRFMPKEYEHGLAKEWPSDLPTLAVLADVCFELDLLTESIRKEHRDGMLDMANAAQRDSDSEEVPIPTQLGAEKIWPVQSGLLFNELYCRLFHCGAHTLHLDTPRFRERFRGRIRNFLPPLEFVYHEHWKIFLGVLNDDSARGISPSYSEPTQQSPIRHAWHQVTKRAKFIRYLCSFGIQLIIQVSQCPSLERKALILSKLSDFEKLATTDPRYYFPRSNDISTSFRYRREDWAQLVTLHGAYGGRCEWNIGPWFEHWGEKFRSQEEWWQYVGHWEQTRFLARMHETLMRHRILSEPSEMVHIGTENCRPGENCQADPEIKNKEKFTAELRAAASIIALIQMTDRVVDLGRAYIGSATDASKDLRRILAEVSAVKTILENLQFLRENDAEFTGVLQVLERKDGLVSQCTHCVSELEMLFPSDMSSSVGAGPGTGKQRAKRVLKSLSWPMKEPKANKLLQELAAHKLNLDLALTTESMHQDEGEDLVCWIICQLCRHARSIPDQLLNALRSNHELLLADLLNLLRICLGNIDVLYIVVDVLDESPPRNTLLGVLRTLLTDEDLSRLSILATSRQYVDIEFGLAGTCTSLPMVHTDVQKDILNFVSSSLSEAGFGRWPEDLRKEMQDALTNRAQGIQVSMGVRTVLTLLNDHGGLDDDPLPYYFFELAIQHSKGGDFDKIGDLREVCGCLITVNMKWPDPLHDDHTVALAHYTVREFLQSDRISQGRFASLAMLPQEWHRIYTRNLLHVERSLAVYRSPDHQKPKTRIDELIKYCDARLADALRDWDQEITSDNELVTQPVEYLYRNLLHSGNISEFTVAHNIFWQQRQESKARVFLWFIQDMHETAELSRLRARFLDSCDIATVMEELCCGGTMRVSWEQLRALEVQLFIAAIAKENVGLEGVRILLKAGFDPSVPITESCLTKHWRLRSPVPRHLVPAEGSTAYVTDVLLHRGFDARDSETEIWRRKEVQMLLTKAIDQLKTLPRADESTMSALELESRDSQEPTKGKLFKSFIDRLSRSRGVESAAEVQPGEDEKFGSISRLV
ncbi:uncharacterized protein PG986_003751 [Apiospora aurea]|uniref:Nephrocystin 3-like N-terminal domain-containing protein n=1 Tax=Apiospora aurea TaxID=335848 RepID=A0ABR1QSK2_9PEZI